MLTSLRNNTLTTIDLIEKKKETFEFIFLKPIILRLFVFPESGMVCINEKEDKYDEDGAVGGLIKLSYFFIYDLSKPCFADSFWNSRVKRRPKEVMIESFHHRMLIKSKIVLTGCWLRQQSYFL